MINPICYEDLYQINDNYKIVEQTKDYLIVDDWYTNFDEIYKVLQEGSIPRWKWSKQGRNFKDYYDCRRLDNAWFVDKEWMLDYELMHHTLAKTLHPEMKTFELNHKHDFIFNYFKHIKTPPSQHYQMAPHTDSRVAFIVYMDKVSNGGTALYSNCPQPDEFSNIFVDVEDYEKTIIKSKPNRLLVFNAKIPHGGYIENHTAYLNDWRINQVNFSTVDGK